MSEHSGEQPPLSRGSSLSIFSGFGTSSVSGGSDSGGGGGGHVNNVEDLSTHQLENVVDDIKSSLKLLILETLMFESYYDRLMSGQVSLTPTDPHHHHSLAPQSRYDIHAYL